MKRMIAAFLFLAIFPVSQSTGFIFASSARATCVNPEIARLDPKSEITAQQWFERGKTALEHNDINSAIACFQKSVKKDPKFFDAHLYLGIAYATGGYLDTAMTELKEALNIKPDDAKAHTYLGLVYRKKGDLDSAVSELKLAIRGDPNNSEAHFSLALTYSEQHNIEGYLSEAREVLRLNPNLSVGHVLLGDAYSGKGDPESAIRELNEALKLDPSNPFLHYIMGMCYFQKGDFAAAIGELKESSRLFPPSPGPHRGLGLIYFLKGDYAAAEKSFNTALSMQGFTDAYSALFVYICRTKQKGPSEETNSILRTTLTNVESNKKWERALLQYYLGEMTEKKLLEMATAKREQCEGNFYVGMMYWLKGDSGKASQYWQAAVKTEATDVVEYYAAKMLLEKKRL